MTNSKNKPSVSIVFSFRNEEAVLPELIRRVRNVMSHEKSKGTISAYAMVFVNDDSVDASLEILKKAAQEENDIRVLTMSRPFGVSTCVMAGLEHARGDAVIYMDADLQDPVELIPELIKVWQSEANIDVVHTIRRNRRGESAIKMAITKLGYAIIGAVSSVKIPSQAGDFKLLFRRVVNHLIKMKEKDPYIRGLVCWVGFKQKEVYYDRQERFAGETKFPVFGWKVIYNFFGSALISFTSVPLKLASMLGISAILIDLFLLIHVLSEKLQGRAIPGWTAIMIAILFMGGVQLFCIGLIGLYLNSIFEEAKRRPNYIVSSTIGFDENQDTELRF